MSKDQVSRICGELDEQVEAFRTRPLEGAFPYLWLDARHLKVRDRGNVHSKALMVAFAVHSSGRREVIGIEIADSETEAEGGPARPLPLPALPLVEAALDQQPRARQQGDRQAR